MKTKKYYCKQCNINEISYRNWLRPEAKCRSCAAKNAVKRNYFCQDCGKKVSSKHVKRCKDCHLKWLSNFNRNKLGIKSTGWKTGKHKDGGYIYVYVYFYPRPSNKHYVLEHRLVVEADLNGVSYEQWVEWGRNGNYPKNARFLTSKEMVHHINGIKDDNRIENLSLLPSKKYHNTHTIKIIYQKKIRKLEKIIKELKEK